MKKTKDFQKKVLLEDKASETERRRKKHLQWNNKCTNRFDILYKPKDPKHCVIIYK